MARLMVYSDVNEPETAPRPRRRAACPRPNTRRRAPTNENATADLARRRPKRGSDVDADWLYIVEMRKADNEHYLQRASYEELMRLRRVELASLYIAAGASEADTKALKKDALVAVILALREGVAEAAGAIEACATTAASPHTATTDTAATPSPTPPHPRRTIKALQYQSLFSSRAASVFGGAGERPPAFGGSRAPPAGPARASHPSPIAKRTRAKRQFVAQSPLKKRTVIFSSNRLAGREAGGKFLEKKQLQYTPENGSLSEESSSASEDDAADADPIPERSAKTRASVRAAPLTPPTSGGATPVHDAEPAADAEDVVMAGAQESAIADVQPSNTVAAAAVIPPVEGKSRKRKNDTLSSDSTDNAETRVKKQRQDAAPAPVLSHTAPAKPSSDSELADFVPPLTPPDDLVNPLTCLRRDLSKCRRATLQFLCHERALPVDGSKKVLITRLLVWRAGVKNGQIDWKERTPLLLDADARQDSQESQVDVVEELQLHDKEIPPEKLTKLDKIGSGGFKDVYKGLYRRRNVAISDIRGILGEMDIKELGLLRDLSHPNIVQFIGVSIPREPRDVPVMIVTELCENGDLYDYLRGVEPPSFSRVLEIMIGVARGLAYLHTHSPAIIHRDLKSSNVLITARGAAKLADFGLARVRNSKKSVVRSLVGTVNWQAPELWVSHPRYDEKADIYSAGLVFWEILQWHMPVKRYPYEGMNEHAIYEYAGQKGLRPATAGMGRTWGIDILNLMEAMWVKEPARRPTALQVVDQLETMLMEERAK